MSLHQHSQPITAHELLTVDSDAPSMSTPGTRWHRVQLGDLARVCYGKARVKTTGDIPVIGSGGVFGKTEEPLVTRETIVIGRKGAAGAVFYSPSPCYPTDTTFYLDWTQQVHVPFVYFELMLNGLMPDRSVIPSLSRSDVEDYPLLLPPLPEQRAIAHVLCAIQDAIQARHRELELERERKAALMQHLFTHGTRGEPAKQTDIGEMPESWKTVQLGQLCTVGRSFIQTGPFGSQLHASDYKPVGVPVVNPTHLGFNTVIEDHLPKIDKVDADRLAKHYLRVGDILISRRGDFSRYSYVTRRQEGWLCGTGSLLIRLANPQVDNYFVSVCMSTSVVQDYLAQNAVGSIMPNLNTKILEGMPLPLPPLDEQQLIGTALKAADEMIDAVTKEVTVLQELFRALLEELMTGRLSALPLVRAESEVPA